MLDAHCLVTSRSDDRLLLLESHEFIHFVLLIALNLYVILVLATLHLVLKIEWLPIVPLKSGWIPL